MSGKRMVHESLFSSEELSELPVEARYLYIATIVHADDHGRMRADAKYLKLKAFPFDDFNNYPVDNVLTWRNALATELKLFVIYEVDGKEYLYHPKWDKWQTLRKDRLKPTDCPEPATICQPTVNQVTTNCQPLVAEVREVNRSEVKLTEPKGREVTEVSNFTSFASQGSTTPKRELKFNLPEDLEIPKDPLEAKVKAGHIKLLEASRFPK